MIDLGKMTIPERQRVFLTAARGVLVGLLVVAGCLLPASAGAQRDAMRMGEQFGTVVIKQAQSAIPPTPSPAAEKGEGGGLKSHDALRPAENLQIEKKEKPQ
jgi:hypothetical protein